MKKLTGESLNITEENLKALEQLFPEAFEEGKIDFAVLRQLLGDFVDDEEERYSFKWNGKGKALRLSQTPSLGTLRPCKEESKDWDTTQNLYIEGDNLEVLKLLQKSYYGKVKMIYIDPPYNTGGDFVYKDDFRDNIENYKRVTGQVDGEGHKIDTNTESNGRFHTDWLNMMYPRLRLARNLLSDDGVIFISIDDNEQENLKKICDEVFGENNGIGPIIQNKQNAKNDTVNIQKNHEFIMVYRKHDSALPILIRKVQSYKDVLEENGEYYYLNDPITTRGEGGTLNARPNLGYTVYYNPVSKDIIGKIDYDKELARTSNDVNIVYSTDQSLVSSGYIPIRPPMVRGKLGCWTWDLTRFNVQKHNIKITGSSKSYSVRKCTFVDKNLVQVNEGKPQYSIISDANSRSILDFSTNDGTNIFNTLMDINGIFNNPKNLGMIKYFLSLIQDKSITVLDFFSGSATTAHAVMQLNAEDGGNRKFIMVQLPEPTAENSEAAKAGYKNICEIGKERIRRAGEKIKAEAGDRAADLDIGFKVFKLDSSNLQKWNPQPEDLQLALQEATDNFLPGRSQLDVVYEIMLKMGLDLALPIEERQASGETVYIIGSGALMICLGEHITLPVTEEIAKLHKEYDSELWQVVFRDTGFASDMDKTNIKETLKTAGLDEDSFVCV